MINSNFIPAENKSILQETINQEKLGMSDLNKNLTDIWTDLNFSTKNFHFNTRELTKIDICLSAFYNYESTLEMNLYKIQHGKDIDRISEVFINFFPYQNKSILIMGYNLKDESILKPYFNTYFKESEKRVQRKLTNLILFACENWIFSEDIYIKKFKNIEKIMAFTNSYSINTLNERQNFNLNLYKESFKSDLTNWYNSQ
ncbi:hypothetical protein [Empedobacter tilapiae]